MFYRLTKLSPDFETITKKHQPQAKSSRSDTFTFIYHDLCINLNHQNTNSSTAKMQSYIQYAALLALASIPSTFAAECAAVGRLNVNAAGGFGGGGGAVTSGSSITLYKGDQEVGGYDVCDTCDPVCSDLINIDSDLAETFSWGASCEPTNFKYDTSFVQSLRDRFLTEFPLQ